MGGELQNIGRFRVVERLGRGMQGTVYLANDPHLQRPVAIKLFASSWRDKALEEQSFPDEARIVAMMRHPNIVSVFEAGQHEKRPYLVFEYVRGITLRHVLTQHGPLPAAKAQTLFGQILAGVGYAHQQGVIHLDLSPKNIIISTEGVAKIMDFGLSRSQGSQLEGKSAERIEGSPRYMSPEHFQQGELGPTSDVFALGLIFYEVLVGEPALSANSALEIGLRLIREDVKLPNLDGMVDPRIVRLIKRAVERDPLERYHNASVMNDAFGRCLECAQAPTQATPTEHPHGTINFLLRRMERRKDFPALSEAVHEVNRMTAERSTASSSKLASAIERDYALTNKLLRLANSAFYGHLGQGVTTIADAVRVLGTDQIRLAVNSLSFFGQFKGHRSTELKDRMVASLLAGLMARLWASRYRVDAEEAFIGALFYNLGLALTIYYFPEEWEEVQDMVEQHHADPESASIQVLGVSYTELGTSIASLWKFPPQILEIMKGVGDRVLTPHDDLDRLTQLAALANETVDAAQQSVGDSAARPLALVRKRFAASSKFATEDLKALVAEGLDTLLNCGALFEIDVHTSPLLRDLAELVAVAQSDTDEPGPTAGKTTGETTADPSGASVQATFPA